MDQVKIGNFLKKLRKEKGITQEQLAEILNVSGRTVSRWETGNNMPDISILVDIANYYDISIPEKMCIRDRCKAFGRDTYGYYEISDSGAAGGSSSFYINSRNTGNTLVYQQKKNGYFRQVVTSMEKTV